MRLRRHLPAVVLVLLAVLAAGTSAARADWTDPPLQPPSCRVPPALLDVGSLALGLPNRGRLRRGVPFPDETPYSFTWDLPLAEGPNPRWRRMGTQKLVLTVKCVLHRHVLEHPLGARIGVADLSLPHGGRFGSAYGGLGHASHQNGLDADILYPRRDRAEIPPDTVADIDVAAAQDLVSAFVRAGARYVFVSPVLHRRGRLRGPRGVVQPLVYHDDHMHVRIRP